MDHCNLSLGDFSCCSAFIVLRFVMMENMQTIEPCFIIAPKLEGGKQFCVIASINCNGQCIELKNIEVSKYVNLKEYIERFGRRPEDDEIVNHIREQLKTVGMSKYHWRKEDCYIEVAICTYTNTDRCSCLVNSSGDFELPVEFRGNVVSLTNREKVLRFVESVRKWATDNGFV